MDTTKGLSVWTDTAKQRKTALSTSAKNQTQRAEIEAVLLAAMKELLPQAIRQAKAGKPALLRLVARHVKQQGSQPNS